MEKLNIDYSMGRGKKATFLLLGSIHVVIGSIALIGALIQHLHLLIIIALSIYTGMGIIIVTGMVNRLHHYITIDEKQLVFKSNFNRSASKFNWDEIHSVILSPSRIRLITGNQSIDVNMGVLRFQDIRRIKNQIADIAAKKGIPCQRIKQIRKDKNQIFKASSPQPKHMNEKGY
ncbi:MAG: hypothetical protein ACRCSQ_06265 [Bacteroidales bacterium]